MELFRNIYPNDYFVFGEKVYYPEENYYRVNHDWYNWRDNLPEVNPLFPNHFVEFGRDFQLLERELNWVLSGQEWRAVHTWQRAFNNQQGYDRPGDPRADWINMRDLTYDPPRQEVLVCGGAILKRKFIDDAYLYPEYINTNRPAPTLEWLLKRPYLFFDAVNIDWTSDGAKIRRFPQGDGHRVFILLLASKPIRIPLSKVTQVKRSSPALSPYQFP